MKQETTDFTITFSEMIVKNNKIENYAIVKDGAVIPSDQKNLIQDFESDVLINELSRRFNGAIIVLNDLNHQCHA